MTRGRADRIVPLEAGRGGQPVTRTARVLVLRSCRAAQFADAVAGARLRHPHAEVVALSHRGHREALLAAGVDRVLEMPGRRFGPFRAAPWTLARLASERFDEVVIPQMSAYGEEHVNLYWLIHLFRFRQVVVIGGDAAPQIFSRRTFASYTVRQTLRRLVLCDAPVLLALLLAACVARRRRAPQPERRRVLHIISSLGVGGAQRQLAELVRRTPPDRFDVEVLVLGRDDGDFSRRWLPGARITYLSEWPRLAASVLEVRRHCRQGRYDLVHTWLFMANVIGVAGARLAGVPRVIASVRNLSLWKRTWYRQWWFRPADVLCARAADVVTVNADALRADHGAWALYPAGRIEVVPNGLDPSQFLVDARDARSHVRATAGLPEDAVVIGTVGRLAPEKDHETFLRVVRALRDRDFHVRGVIVGDGQRRSGLEAAAARMGLAGAVTFLGERTDARRLVAGFDVFVLTSIIEGFPNVLLEAALLGVPAVASRVGGSPDVLEDESDLFEPGDDDAAARRVMTLVNDPAEAAAHAERARQRALADFTADRTARRWFALYGGSSEETVQ